MPALSASTPPSERADSGGSNGAELAMGTAVFFQQPGSAVERIETRVTGKTIQPDGTVLYRLEKGAKGSPLMVERSCLTVVTDEAQPCGAKQMLLGRRRHSCYRVWVRLVHSSGRDCGRSGKRTYRRWRGGS